MCSNTSLSGGGGGGGDCFYSKKPKRQRVPKRGPGVAELEKILREQEKRTDFDKAKNDGLSLISSISSCYHHHQPQSPVISSSNSLPTAVSFAPNSNHFNLPISNFYNSPNINNNCNNKPPLRGKNGVQIAGSGNFSPEHALLPTMWNSCKASSDDVGGQVSALGFQFSTNLSNGSNNQLFPSSRLMQRSQQSPPSMKNHFPYQVVSSSTTTSSAGPCHGREPPSNQTSYHHCTSIWPEEDKVVGVKRSRPFSMEIPPIPPLRYQIPAFSSQINRLDCSFSCGSHSTIDLESSGRISREMKPVSSSLEVNIKNCNTEIGAAENGNFLLFGCPTTPPSPQEETPKFNPFPFQECSGDYSSKHRSSSKGGSIHKKPFYSFITPKDPIGMVETNFISLNNDRVETRGDGIDLSLRL